jgi:hypothetical protein
VVGFSGGAGKAPSTGGGCGGASIDNEEIPEPWLYLHSTLATAIRVEAHVLMPKHFGRVGAVL